MITIITLTVITKSKFFLGRSMFSYKDGYNSFCLIILLQYLNIIIEN